MRLILVFLSVFFAILLVFWGMQYLAGWFYRLSRFIERKTGNSSLAWNGPLAVFLALIWASWAVWMTHVYAAAPHK